MPEIVRLFFPDCHDWTDHPLELVFRNWGKGFLRGCGTRGSGKQHGNKT
jgi:hypothetical protein